MKIELPIQLSETIENFTVGDLGIASQEKIFFFSSLPLLICPTVRHFPSRIHAALWILIFMVKMDDTDILFSTLSHLM
jgi:hypothetical protein